MRRTLLAALIASALAPSVARAGVVLDARLGVALPRGDVFQGSPLADSVDFTVPVQIELGFRGERLQLGGYLRFAPGRLDASVEDVCDAAGERCSTLDLGLGVQVDLRLSGGKGVPWIGGFFGYEVIRTNTTFLGSPASVSYGGVELGVQGGIDFVWGALFLGPYGAVSAGRYTFGDVTVGGTTLSGDVTSRASHFWISLGLRGGLAL